MSRFTDELDPRFCPLAMELLSQSELAGVPLRVIDMLRTPEEQDVNLANGTSWTKNTLHLPQPCCGKSHAIDVCPIALLPKKGWAPGHRDWHIVGAIGRKLGLKWGVWKKNAQGVLVNVDWGHLEYVEPLRSDITIATMGES